MQSIANTISAFGNVLTNYLLILLIVMFTLLEAAGFSKKMQQFVGIWKDSEAFSKEFEWFSKEFVGIWKDFETFPKESEGLVKEFEWFWRILKGFWSILKDSERFLKDFRGFWKEFEGF